MEKEKQSLQTMDEYILSFPTKVQEILNQLRSVIKEEASEAQEKISYQMPTFYLYGNLVHFAAFKNHIGFYPGPNGIEAFQQELSKYKGGKGSVQFPIEEPLPFELIRAIVRYRVVENYKLEEERKAKKGTKKGTKTENKKGK